MGFRNLQEKLEKYIFITISKRIRTSFSDSPLYLEVRVEELTLKNVVPHSVATAFANIVLPVPGGPTIRTPLQGLLMPLGPFIYYVSTFLSTPTLSRLF